MALAEAFTFASLTLKPQQFQLFQPNAGVNPIRLPHCILNSLVAEPSLFLTRNLTRKFPAVLIWPLMIPVCLSRDRPGGSPVTPYSKGFSPVAGILYSNGLSGWT